MGNIFARRDGKNNNLPPIMSGSHLDTQPTGGRYDGALGVLSALEVIRTLNEFNYVTEAPLEIKLEKGSSGISWGILDKADVLLKAGEKLKQAGLR